MSHVGDGIALIALVLMVQEDRGTGTSVGALLLATSIPRFLGPLAGVVVDRVEQRSLMVACDLGQAAIFGTIAWLDPSFPVLLGLVALAAAFDTLFAPAGRSALPALVRPEQLMRANAWIGMSLNIQVAAGPVLGGLLVTWLGFRGALAANALSFVLSAVFLLGLPPLRAPADGAEPRGFLAVGMDGLRFAWRNRVVRTLIVALFVGVAFAGLDDVALVFLVRDTLGGSPLAYGLVTGAYGVGMLAGSLGLSWKGTAAAAGTVFLLGWVAGGIGAVLTGIAPLIAAGGRRPGDRRCGQRGGGGGDGHPGPAGGAAADARARLRPRRHGGARGTRARVRGRRLPGRLHLAADRVPDRRARRTARPGAGDARAPAGRRGGSRAGAGRPLAIDVAP